MYYNIIMKHISIIRHTRGARARERYDPSEPFEIEISPRPHIIPGATIIITIS